MMNKRSDKGRQAYGPGEIAFGDGGQQPSRHTPKMNQNKQKQNKQQQNKQIQNNKQTTK